jgi:hypothetical protein
VWQTSRDLIIYVPIDPHYPPDQYPPFVKPRWRDARVRWAWQPAPNDGMAVPSQEP